MANTGTNQRTMHIRYRDSDEERALETLAAIDRGEEPEPFFEVSYHDVADFDRVTRPKNLQLLQAIARHEPASIRETARLVERDVRQVHRNLEELEELHLLRFEAEGNRKRPRVWYDGIEVHFPLDAGEDGETTDDQPALSV